MSSRLCAICNSVFKAPQRLRSYQPHHQSKEAFREAADQGCYICQIICLSEEWEVLDHHVPFFKSTWHIYDAPYLPDGWLALIVDAGLIDPSMWVPGSGDETLTQTLTRKPPIWSFILQPATDVADKIGHWVPAPGFDSPGFLDLAEQWLSECLKSHTSSRQRNPDFRPTRLVEILNGEDARISMSHDQQVHGPYISLSHCWGKTKRLKLLESNMAQLSVGIRISDLPTSYREAISVCRRLGLCYIWIDSLCIIQDSKEDWQREAATMKDVYQNSILTIAAAAAAESSQLSFGSRDQSLIRPLEIQPEWDVLEGKAPKEQGELKEQPKGPSYYIAVANMYDAEVEESPLRQRAWVMQEMWLSPRTLSLTKSQLWWECCQGRACEAYPRGPPPTLGPPDQTAASALAPRSRSDLALDPAAMWRQWNRLVEKYNRCQLTMALDRLVAFSGIAQVFQERIPDDRYVAGLWRSQLPQMLFWRKWGRQSGHRPAVYRAPSWSWASVEGPIDPDPYLDAADDNTLEAPCVVIDAVTHHEDRANDKGLLSGGYVRIKGRLTDVSCQNNSHLSLRRADGSWGSIEHPESNNWTRIDFDEQSSDGEPLISYLGSLTPGACSGGHMDGTTRISNGLATWSGRVYSLPLFEWQAEGWPVCGGIVLCQAHNWPNNVFQRVASFVAVGATAVNELKKCSSERTIMIL